MKVTVLLLVLSGCWMVSAGLAAIEPAALDGREVVVQVRQAGKAQEGAYKVGTVIKGRTISLDIPDANEDTMFGIRVQDQNDPVVRQLVQSASYGWAYNRCGLEYFVYYSPAELEARPVVLRLYLVNEKDPSNYRRVITEVRTRRTEALIAGPEESGFLVIFGSDQTDPVMKRLFGTSVYGCPYNKSVRLHCPRVPEENRSRYDWQVCDALGEPLGPAGVEVYLKSGKSLLKLASVTADSQGRFSLSFCAASDSVSLNQRCGLRFEVSTPGYCKNIVEMYSLIREGPLLTANVPAGSIAETRSAWGQVVDGNDNPVAGALVEPAGCTPPGAKGIGSRLYQRTRVVADEQGRFRAYLPVDASAYQIGTLIPPDSEYYLLVEPPAGSKLKPFRGRVTCGKATKIKLDGSGYFHTFAFEDQNGPITDVKILKEIRINIARPGQGNDIWMRFDPCDNGDKFPPGEYFASCDTYRTIVFDPIEVTPNSPEQLVFKPIPAKVYRGRVVDGVTGKAIADAEITALGRPVTRTRTDQAGIFEIKSQPGRGLHVITASKKDYTKFRIIKSSAKQDAAGRYILPDSPLYPAATVRVKPVHGNWTRQAYFRPQWFVLGSDLPAWAKYLHSVAYQHPQDAVWREYEVRANRQESFPVPAGVRLRIQLRVLHDVEWAPVTIADDVRLAQGEVFDVGEVQILPPFAVFVEVLDSAGRAVEGVPVIASGQHDPAVSSSDEQGIAVFEFVGYSKGEFIVKYDPEDDANQPVLHRSIPYEVAGVEDANSSYTIHVPDRLLNQILK